MAIWIDDRLKHRDEYLDMSYQARCLLFDLWMEAKVAHSDGILKESRLSRASDAWSPEAVKELVENDWLHIGATGCRTEFCPPGMAGSVVLHNFLKRQESSVDQKRREAMRTDARKAAAEATNHKRWHVDRGKTDSTCDLCFPTSESVGVGHASR